MLLPNQGELCFLGYKHQKGKLRKSQEVGLNSADDPTHYLKKKGSVFPIHSFSDVYTLKLHQSIF